MVNLWPGELGHALDGAPAEQLWRVIPDEPIEWPGPSVDQIVTEPGDYSFQLELLYDLMAVEFEGEIE